ncbi:hypothetical protein SB49_14125 [Sediminicola sp. YIK13]|uniref:hypothetical protein n=1 Tax=Sediminicola sp. YIK13 TaxID=1453352 RepID=UPI000720D09A|nr:hypothetical protein [Sediminicola sp. YIK13]ALM08805.1 hypothetical protein SB49_14125 [Sediminicola sp. YIK13]
MEKIKQITKLKAILVFVLILCSSILATAQGPNAPEAGAFEPVDATDMVNLVTGDMSYVLPLLNVPSPEGGYPIALSYHAGIAAEQDASWVGLGWNINPGAINRGVNGYPDDWGKVDYSEFFYDQGYKEDYYSFSAGITFKGGVSVGLGLSWGSNQSLGGYVSASVGLGDGSFGSPSIGATVGTNGYGINGGIGGINGSFGTNGIGIGYGTNPSLSGGSSVGLNLNYSYNSGLSGGVSLSQITGSFQNGLAKTSSLGINFSSNGISVNGKVNGYGAGISTSSSTISASDYDVTVSSTGITVPVYIFYAGYNHQKVTVSLFRYDKLYTSGILNPVVANKLKPYQDNSGLSRLLYENRFMDVNVLPKYKDSMNEYELADNSYLHEENNLVLPNYDNYSVAAQGLSGSISPYTYSELNLSGRGKKLENNDNVYSAYLNHDFTEYNSSVASGIDVNRDAVKKINFTFNNAYNSFLRVETTSIINPNLSNSSIGDNNVLKYFKTNSSNNFSNINSFNNSSEKRKREGNIIETFTNKEIRNKTIAAYGFIEATGINRQEVSTYLDEGIGAYQIITPDGRKYHYSLPVYNFETIYKNFKNQNNEDQNFLEIKKTIPYATHWLLTAITGPDYIDGNSDGKVNEGDFGYWVEFDYGKWTDGYIWETPSGRYDTNEDKNGEKTYSYAWGRKQIYYLDAIKTRTHTALFVKDVRKDSWSVPRNISTSTTSNQYLTGNNYKKIKGSRAYGNVLDQNVVYKNDGSTYTANTQYGYPIIEGISLDAKYVDIPTTPLLHLKQIIVLKNEDLIYNKARGVLINNTIGNIGFNRGFYGTGSLNPHIDFYLTPPQFKLINLNIHQNVLDFKDIEGLNLENFAQQIITFDHDYILAKNSPNSTAVGNGRLSLKKVNFKGKQGIQMIPPYSFSYLSSSTSYNKNNVDDWGYNKNYPQVWSLNEIQTPTGGKVKINYESDSYYTQAASYEDKYFTNISFTQTNNTNTTSGNPIYELTFNDNTNLSDFFKIGKECALSFKLCSNGLDITNTPLKVISIVGNKLTIIPTSKTEVIKYSSRACVVNNTAVTDMYNLKIKNNQHPFYTNTNLNGKEGGGVRIRSIEVIENTKKLTTEYEYTDPVTNKISGITSFAPSEDGKAVPYGSELPAPMVLYSNVKMVNKDDTGAIIGSTAYKFQTLTPFSPESGYIYSIGDAFKVKEQQNQSFNNGKVITNKFTIYNSLATIGRLQSITRYNNLGQRLAYSSNTYKTNLDGDGEIGVTQESHKSLKRVMTKPINSSVYNEVFHVSSTSKVSYPSVLQSSTKVQGGFSNTTNFIKHDFLTGQVLESTTLNSKGEEYKSQLIPAYTKYPSMGSKVDNYSNKNMLVQDAITKTLKKVNGTWKEIGVGITTWKPDKYYTTETIGQYPNEFYLEVEHDIWRKHKNFIWNGTTDNQGIFTSFTGEDDGFIWNDPNSIQPSDWKQISEISLYDKYSMPLEVVDLNGNRVATKMGYKDSKVLANGNAGYSEIYYSGAEDLIGSYFGGGVGKGSGTVSLSYAHTGNKSLQINTGQTGFVVNVIKGKDNKYKASLWSKSGTYNATRLQINGGTPISFNVDEVVRSGDWVQLNFYFDVNTSAIVQVLASGSTIYVDDFRVHPVASTVSSYVYNQWDELTHILGSNNLATQYEYDQVGRLLVTKAEAIDYNGAGTGGFKKVKENQYKFKLVGDVDTNGNGIIETQETYDPLNASISASNGYSSVGTLTTIATGGSGNYRYSYAQGNITSSSQVDNLNYGSESTNNTLYVSSVPCSGGSYGYNAYAVKVKVRDISTGQIVTRIAYYNRTCSTGGGGDPIIQEAPQQ